MAMAARRLWASACYARPASSCAFIGTRALEKEPRPSTVWAAAPGDVCGTYGGDDIGRPARSALPGHGARGTWRSGSGRGGAVRHTGGGGAPQRTVRRAKAGLGVRYDGPRAACVAPASRRHACRCAPLRWERRPNFTYACSTANISKFLNRSGPRGE
jgi:hypothetical protein